MGKNVDRKIFTMNLLLIAARFPLVNLQERIEASCILKKNILDIAQLKMSFLWGSSYI